MIIFGECGESRTNDEMRFNYGSVYSCVFEMAYDEIPIQLLEKLQIQLMTKIHA
jgi:hypothetical protein